MFALPRLLPALLLTSSLVASAEPGRIGVMADVGVPDGATASLVVRPISRVKLHGGVGYNLVAPGIRVGATVSPLWIVAPSLSIEGGRYFEGDANVAAARISGQESDSPLLREVGYYFGNAHIGLDFGGKRGSFYVHAGLSVVRGTVRNLNEAIAEDGEDQGDAPNVEFRSDPVVTLTIPSARLGFLVFF